MLDVLREVVKSGFWDAEVLSEHFARRMSEPIAEEESLVLGEVSIVEYQEEFTAVLEFLDRMWKSGGKIPDVARPYVIDEVAALRIDRREPCASGEQVAPFRLLMPMHFADAARRESHVDPGHCCRGRQFAHRHFARPAALGEAIAGRCKREFQVRNSPGVGIGRGQKVRVLRF